MFDPGAAQVTKKLGNVFVGKGLTRLQLHNQFAGHKQIGKIIAKHCSVFVQHLQCVLLPDLNASLGQPMGQPVFIDFFQMAVF